ncbi:hypothetical protein ACFLTB_07010, partial [Chloroflexota bacterium]
YGWRPTSLVSGIFILVIGITCALFFRQRPEKYGYLPDGDLPPSVEADRQTGQETKSVSDERKKVTME